MADGRVHVSDHPGPVDVHVIVSWPDGTPLADIEEAIKRANRAAVTEVRTRHSAPKETPRA